MPSIGSASVSPTKRAGSSSTSAIVQPSSVGIVPRQRHERQQHAADLQLGHAPRCGDRHAMLARPAPPHAWRRSGRGRHWRDRRRDADPLAAARPCARARTLESCGQSARVATNSPGVTRGSRAAGSCASGGWMTGAPSNTSRSGLPTMRSTRERSSSCPAAPTSYQASSANQARSCNARRKRSASATSATAT